MPATNSEQPTYAQGVRMTMVEFDDEVKKAEARKAEALKETLDDTCLSVLNKLLDEVTSTKVKV